MNIHSIRWRLPLSYAAIALLATLSLGSVMLLVLKNYYTSLERAYLNDQARALQPIVEQILLSDASPHVLQDQVAGLAFLSQTQIRVLDKTDRVLADSSLSSARQAVAVSSSPTGMVFNLPTNSSTPPSATTDFESDNQSGVSVQVVPLSGQAQSVPVSTARSSQVASLKFKNLLGTTLEVYNGPAYGSDILNTVAIAWAVAGIFSTVLAGLAGWYASRQVTQPVLILTAAARQMETGNLAARVDLPLEKQQEFLSLAHAFNGMAGQVETTVSTLRAFVSDAAHELNTPLTALKTNLELAAAEPNSARRTLFLTRAIEQNQRLETLTHSLLDLSRIEAAQAPLEPVDLCQLVAETGERFASRAEQAERSFTLLMPENTVTISGNQRQLERALGNLLENALKFTPPGGTITLKLEADATLSVSDTGIGIRPDDLPQLFKRFHRGHNAADYAGNGLGLAIVKAVMDAHAGTVHAESGGPGCGSTFTLVFPGLTIPAKV